MTAEPFKQKGITEFIYATDGRGEYIWGFLLSCKHRVRAVRRRPRGSRRTSAPCPKCGSGTRADAERAYRIQSERHGIERAIKRAQFDAEAMGGLVDVLEAALLLNTKDIQHSLTDRVERVQSLLTAAGLVHRDRRVARDDN